MPDPLPLPGRRGRGHGRVAWRRVGPAACRRSRRLTAARSGCRARSGTARFRGSPAARAGTSFQASSAHPSLNCWGPTPRNALAFRGDPGKTRRPDSSPPCRCAPARPRSHQPGPARRGRAREIPGQPGVWMKEPLAVATAIRVAPRLTAASPRLSSLGNLAPGALAA